jgi:chaperonin GroEL
MKDNIYVGQEARDKLLFGCDKVADAVKGTLGAAGYNGLLEHYDYPYSITTNDGISIAREIRLEDPVENIGANLMKEIAQRSDRQGGDGTTTAITLAQAILHEGIKSDAAPMALKKSLEECIPVIEASIKDQTKLITESEVGRVAAISAEDEGIGALIQEIYEKIGKDGILYPDISKTFTDHYTLGSGVKITDAGITSPYMCDVDEKTMQPMNAAKLTNARVLITKQKITSARTNLETIVGQLRAASVSELVIFCDEMEPTVIPDIVQTRFKSGFRMVVVKVPTIWKDQWFEDIAKLTGATIIDPAAGISFANLKMMHLGTVGSFLADKNDTFLDGVADISEYLKELDGEGSDESKIRAARLNTKTARLFVGAPTDAALSYRRLKVEDARNAAWQALHGGVVAGGGTSLMRAANLMPDTVGGKILRFALKSPTYQILMNAGLEISHVGNNPKGSIYVDGADFQVNRGYDVKSMKCVDMFEAGILDPATVVMGSVRNAISVAATVLTARVVTVIPRSSEQTAQQQMPSL